MTEPCWTYSLSEEMSNARRPSKGNVLVLNTLLTICLPQCLPSLFQSFLISLRTRVSFSSSTSCFSGCNWVSERGYPCKTQVTCPAGPSSQVIQPTSGHVCGTTAYRTILKTAPKPAYFRAWATPAHEMPVFAPTSFTPQTCRDAAKTQKCE